MKENEKELFLNFCTSTDQPTSLKDLFSDEFDQTSKSYFIDNDIRCGIENDMDCYDFETPHELKNKILDMWEKQGFHEMNTFATIATISAFKYRNENIETETDQSIPVYIYNF